MAEWMGAVDHREETRFIGARLLAFPTDKSYGVLRVARENAYGEWHGDSPIVAEARGVVAMPYGVAVCLCASSSFTAMDFAALEWLNEDDLLDLSTVAAVEDVLAALISLPRLRRVRFPQGTHNEHLGILRAVPHLHELVLRDTAITDAGTESLRVLGALRALDLAHTRLGTPGVIPLRHLTTLETLDLSLTHIGDEALFYLRSLTHLRSLTLASYHRMRTTDLGVDGVTDVGLGYLRPLVRLESLRVQSQSVTDAGLAALSGLSRMRYLTLPAAQRTRASPTSRGCGVWNTSRRGAATASPMRASRISRRRSPSRRWISVARLFRTRRCRGWRTVLRCARCRWRILR